MHITGVKIMKITQKKLAALSGKSTALIRKHALAMLEAGHAVIDSGSVRYLPSAVDYMQGLPETRGRKPKPKIMKRGPK